MVNFKVYKLPASHPKKYKAVSDRCSVSFGAKGYSDMTRHKDPQRMKRYLSRHRKRESWGTSGVCTAGWWSRHLLWNKPSLRGSIADINRRGGVRVSMASGSPPLRGSRTRSIRRNRRSGRRSRRRSRSRRYRR